MAVRVLVVAVVVIVSVVPAGIRARLGLERRVAVAGFISMGQPAAAH